jgi:hypothetical protein
MEKLNWVGEDRKLSIYETSPDKCNQCGLVIPKEKLVQAAMITWCSIVPLRGDKWKIEASLNGHSIMKLEVTEPCRYELQ